MEHGTQAPSWAQDPWPQSAPFPSCRLSVSPSLPICLVLGLRGAGLYVVIAPRPPSWERTEWGPGTEPGLMEGPSPGPLSLHLLFWCRSPDLPAPSTVIPQRFSRELTKQLLLCENKTKHMRMAESSSFIPSPPAWSSLPSPTCLSAQRTLLEAPGVASLPENPEGRGTPQDLAKLGFREFQLGVLSGAWLWSLLLGVGPSLPVLSTGGHRLLTARPL